MTSCRVLILDFDGVVIESNDVKTNAFRYVFDRFPEYAGAMLQYHHEHVSLPRFAKFDHLLKLLGKEGDSELRNQLAGSFSKKVFEGIMEVPLVKGAVSFLKVVSQQLPVYLASVTPEEELNQILEARGLSSWFRGVYGCPPWTKPGAIRDVLAKEGVQPDEVILIGDSAGDQQAAEQCGIGFIARDSGLRFPVPPALLFKDLNEIEKYFRSNIS